jgi:raffinose/stachyose/melibiose transport system permease protein
MEKSLSRKVTIWIIAVIWLAVTAVPFFFMLQSGFKVRGEILTGSVWALPKAPTLTHFVAIITGNFPIYLKNSLVVVVGSVAIILIVSSMSSFVFSRIKFRFRRFLFSTVIAGMAIPIHITLVPVYLLINFIGIYDSIFALIGPYVALHIPLSVFIITEYMRTIPRELEEAARIDGCNLRGVFFRIILPLSKPSLITVSIFNAVFIWNEFIFVLVLTTSVTSRTIPLGIWEYQGRYAGNIPAIMAILTLSSLPMIIAYLIGQERIIKGMVTGALKG